MPSKLTSRICPWSDKSTYIQLPSFFEGIKPEVNPIESINDARVLLKLGDSVTTDHISPAGSFPADGPAGIVPDAKWRIQERLQLFWFSSWKP